VRKTKPNALASRVNEFSVEIDRDAERVTDRYRIDDKEEVETYKITGSNLEP